MIYANISITNKNFITLIFKETSEADSLFFVVKKEFDEHR